MNQLYTLFSNFLNWLAEILSRLESWKIIFSGISLFVVWLVQRYWDDIINYLIISRKNAYKRILPLRAKDEYLKSLRFYIETKWQYVDPGKIQSISENVTRPIKATPLLEYFFTDVFDNPDSNSRFIIYAETGMGKSTFMLKLFFNYYRKFIRKYHLVLIRVDNCNEPRDLDNFIEKIKDKTKTILLIDGLDEDLLALKDYLDRLKKITEMTMELHKVIITSRIQLPPDYKSEFVETQIRGTNNREKIHYFPMYISPFDPRDTIEYVKKRYPLKIRRFFQRNQNKQKEAIELVRQFKDVFARPLVLSYIDSLAIAYNEYCFEIDLYEKIVERWTERETERKDNQVIIAQKDIGRFQTELKQFARMVALEMYQNHPDREGHVLTLDELAEIDSPLSIEQKRVQTLLTRTDKLYKFAHQSFMDFFLFQKIVEDNVFRASFKFAEFPQVHLFYNEFLLKAWYDNLKTTNTAIFNNYDKSSDKAIINKKLIYIDDGIQFRDFEKNPISLVELEAAIKGTKRSIKK